MSMSMSMKGVTWIVFAIAATARAEPATPIALPDGAGGIGFDDLRYDAATRTLLIPAGRTGNLDLIDPETHNVTPIGGFSKIAKYDAGHGQSVTSVDADEGFLFATDRTAKKLMVIDRGKGAIVGETALAGPPDYVRFVAPTRELWVTEPHDKRIEVFSLSKASPPVVTHAAFIDVPGGPESLAIDATRGRAYTHRWESTTMAIDLASRKIVEKFPAGCGAPRGIALDEPRGFLLVGCEDGTATVLDLAHHGVLLSMGKSGKGVDIIAYDRGRAHLYLPGDESATLAIFGVSPGGALTLLGTSPTVKEAHCVVSDDRGGAWVCDPKGGRLLLVRDPFPATH